MRRKRISIKLVTLLVLFACVWLRGETHLVKQANPSLGENQDTKTLSKPVKPRLPAPGNVKIRVHDGSAESVQGQNTEITPEKRAKNRKPHRMEKTSDSLIKNGSSPSKKGVE